jgi:DNA polymerase I-like protein with 3'-5' exonuclease and polymerase domains
MNPLAIDVESTIYNKGNPYDPRNRLICYSVATDGGFHAVKFNDTSRENLQYLCDASDLLVGFNFKFDLHWLIKSGLEINKPVWCVQLAEFILSNQTNKFPSLDATCEKYGIARKLDIVATEYWDKGINTDEIPWEVLEEYSAHDANITLQCYYAQLKQMTPAQIMLCKLQCMDLLILREMEGNGLLFDEELCERRSVEVDDQISKIRTQLSQFYPNVPINFSSNDHLSAFLYGGRVVEVVKEHVGFYKTGERAGQPKYQNKELEHLLPRLYEPLKGSELLKEGMYATDEATLKKLKGKKDVVELLLELSKLEKRNGTYYKGLVKLREEMHWPKGKLHGQFNQCVASTGRLSSSRPNLQNFDSSLQDIFITAYNE